MRSKTQEKLEKRFTYLVEFLSNVKFGGCVRYVEFVYTVLPSKYLICFEK